MDAGVHDTELQKAELEDMMRCGRGLSNTRSQERRGRRRRADPPSGDASRSCTTLPTPVHIRGTCWLISNPCSVRRFTETLMKENELFEMHLRRVHPAMLTDEHEQQKFERKQQIPKRGAQAITTRARAPLSPSPCAGAPAALVVRLSCPSLVRRPP